MFYFHTRHYLPYSRLVYHLAKQEQFSISLAFQFLYTYTIETHYYNTKYESHPKRQNRRLFLDDCQDMYSSSTYLVNLDMELEHSVAPENPLQLFNQVWSLRPILF